MATGLILARDQIFNLFADIGDIGGGSRSDAETINLLREEIADLKSSVDADAAVRVELENLRKANTSLQTSLESERSRADQLQLQLNQLDSGAVEDPEFGTQLTISQAELDELSTRLNKAETENTRLNKELEAAQRSMVGFSRENSRLNAEIEGLRDEVDSLSRLRRENERLRNERDALSRDLRTAESQIQVLESSAREHTSSQLTEVNTEYRRVLDLLRESRGANNQKQERIDELLTENSRLQRELNNYKSRFDRQNRELLADQRIEPASEITTEPKAIKIVRPTYPVSAIKRGISGIVRLKVLISEIGEVIEAEVVSSPDPMKSLDRAALRAVRQWRFSPALKDGRPIRAWHSVPMDFSLKRED